MSAPDVNLPSPDLPALRWGLADLHAEADAAVRWLWQGYLAPGAVTLLTGLWKVGKTTLASVLLGRLKTGGQLAGLPLAAGRAVVLSEESPTLWLPRARKLDLDDHVGWFCQPFIGRPLPEQWEALVERVGELAPGQGVSLVVDPLAAFFPGKSENDAGAMLAALAPLRGLATAGLAVLVLHHPGKREVAAEPGVRGSRALLDCADILIEMRWCRRAGEADRRRRLIALSRYEQTPRQLVIELNTEGTDYTGHGNFAEEEFAGHWELIQRVLRPAPGKLTRGEIYRLWPAEGRPDPGSLYRWLRRAVALGLLRADGRGRKRHPFRYWLAENEGRWRQDPLAVLHRPELFGPPGGGPTG
jgi:hypothetical protein